MRTLPPGLQILTTEDGSPTLSLHSHVRGTEERMHHSAGALSESLYIYHEALKAMLDLDLPVRVLSLGLGLGYNEWITLATCPEGTLWSFEQNDFLRTSFESWLLQDDARDPLTPVFTRALQGVARHFNLPPSELKARGIKSQQEQRWQLRGEYPQAAADLTNVTCLFFDAFSKTWDSSLWQEDHLRHTLENLMAPRGVFASYAATGSLNRALKSLGFCPIIKRGFSNKRESTLAIRKGFG